jgi:hypothetical protein
MSSSWPRASPPLQAKPRRDGVAPATVLSEKAVVQAVREETLNDEHDCPCDQEVRYGRGPALQWPTQQAGA